ncbi:flavin reductase [Rhodopseudomonas sp.]|uniref:flavin reductase n=1 Tax=Rhodopseudomonas sp. TaxID=1078 RepID=UPI0039E4FAD0
MTTVERSEFREAMSRLGAAVNIVTTDGAAGLHGLTASAVCSVTDDPPTLLVCVNRASNVHAALSANGVLCVNVLASRHQELSNLFGRGGIPVHERFAGAEWHTLSTGAPALADAVVSLDCSIAQVTDVGTHSVFFCRVQAIALSAHPEGLIYFNRAYHDIAPRAHDVCHS